MTPQNTHIPAFTLSSLTSDPSHLVILLDTSPLMCVHEDEVAELLREARDAGTAVRTFAPTPLGRAHGDGDVGAVRPWPLDAPLPAGATAGLVITDAQDRGWRQPHFRSWLAELNTRLPLHVVHLLDRSTWHRGPVHPFPMRLTGARTNDPAAWSPAHPDDDAVLPEGSTALPVLSPENPQEDHLLPSPAAGWEADVWALPVDGSRSDDPTLVPDPVAHFLTHASLGARMLAQRLAQAPVNLPVAHMLHQGIPRDPGEERTRRTEIAEVLGSGLLDPTRPAGDLHDPAAAALEFLPGLRQQLLGRLGDLSTMRSVFFALGVEFEEAAQVYEWLSRLETGAPPRIDLPEREEGLARAVLPALRQMPGEYRRFATRIEDALGIDPPMPRAAPPGAAREPQPEGPPSPREEQTPDVSTTDPLDTESAGSEPISRTGGFSRRRRRSSAQLRGLPQHNRHFTGRTGYLEHIRSSFDSPEVYNGLYLLTGGGGIGKTQIAIQYAHQHRDEYDLIWWFSANNDADVQQAYLNLARFLGIPGDLGNYERTVERVHEALQFRDDVGYWLLIFDDVEDLKLLRQQGLPTGRGGDILITSREQSWTNEGHSDGQTVLALTPEESATLLRRVCPQGLEDDVLTLRIAEKLEYFPLALAQMGAYLRDSLISPEEFLEQLEHGFDALVDEVSEFGEGMHGGKPLAAAWNVQLENLSRGNERDRELKQLVREFIQLCSFFAPRPLKRTLFHRARGISDNRALSQILGDDRTLNKVLRYMSRHSLVDLDRRNYTFQFHGSFQAVVRNKLAEDERVRLRDLAHRLLAQSDPLGPENPQNWPEYQIYYAHAVESQAWRSRDVQVRNLVRNISVYLLETNNPIMGQRLIDSAISSWYDDPAQRFEMELLRNTTLRLQGEYSLALEEADRIFSERRELDGEDSDEVLSARRARAIAMGHLGEFEHAMEEFHAIRERVVELYTEEDENALVAAHDVAVAQRVLFRFAEALEIDEANVRRRRHMFGANGIPTLRSQQALAIDLLGLGRMDEAATMLEDCLHRFESEEAADSSHAVDIPLFQSLLTRRMGNHELALELSQGVADAHYLRDQLRNRTEVFVYNIHAVSLAFTKNHERAELLAERLLHTVDNHYAQHHFAPWITRVNAAIVLRGVGRFDDALELDRIALDNLARLLPSEPGPLAPVEINLGNDLYALGRLQEALEQDTKALDTCEAGLGPDHLFTLIARRNKLISRRALGADVGEEWAQLRSEFVAGYGPDHRYVRGMDGVVRLDADFLPISW
ncbi:tetratricopeptide repeat protein [Nocardiopsis sp. HNM0947]|uniref:Tetratricopeptide repeat protein n=1 Tax=Nocardiopsis coralli TaxID=2772213 RepID=A0ABR9PD39_9ACTN|nr:FxSxx-COOH system tetratricopeptide repeat protein [Nocardiopsis coralli]MBE3001762.1 tetratricopeptide repeat protein [Nocardiopsis coralli]